MKFPSIDSNRGSIKTFSAIQTPILNRFGNVIYADVGCIGEIGNGAGDFKNAVVGPGRQSEFVDGAFKKIAGDFVNPAVFFNMPVDHLGIAVNFCSFKPFELARSGCGNTGSDNR